MPHFVGIQKSSDSASSIAGHGLWCHNPPWYEKSRQPRETNLPAPVSKISERTLFLDDRKADIGDCSILFPVASRAWV
jgi:hypothetical protein